MYDRTCTGCGNEFATTNFQQKRCNKNCGTVTKHAARAHARLHNDIDFIGVDGEGVDRPDGKHEYVMLSVGSSTLWKDGSALALQDILSFLYERYADNPGAAYVGFFLGYDFIQWEKLLPERQAYLLLTNAGIAERKSNSKSRRNPYPDAVVWEGWEVDIMAGRRFKLRPHVHHRSEFTGLCRNRTCRKDLEHAMGDSNYGSDEPVCFVFGESEWTIPADDIHGEDMLGSAKDFWAQFTPKLKAGKGREKAAVHGWMYICDTGPFWQSSFLNVIKPEKWGDHPVCTVDEYKLIKRGKDERGNTAAYGATDYYADMQMYNVLENDILARVTKRLNEGFMNDDIPIKIPKTDWYGPGRAAQLWMDMLHERIADPGAVESNKATNTRQRYSVDRCNEGGILNADIYMSMPSWFYDAAQASYYGGWFEQMLHGHCGNVWEYDINSAYPFIIASLPCLHTTGIHNGSYTQGDSDDYPRDAGRYTLLRCVVSGSNPYIGAMPYRTKKGNISRPNITEGWYWLHELSASQRAGLIDNMEVSSWVSYLPCECTPPFNPHDIGISRMYRMRLDVGKNTPQGIAAKLVYNSTYGKTAQSIGQPKFSNPVYASLITAGCRTLILDAIASHPNGASAVTMVATDGVYFTSRHLGLPTDVGRLGAWDETFKPGMTQLMPGVYWDDNTRAAIKRMEIPKMKSRGVNARDLAKQINHLDTLYAIAHMELEAGREYVWPEIEFTVGFLLDSAKLALQRGKWHEAGKVTHGSKRRISSNPMSKRNPMAYRDDTGGGFTRTKPYREFAVRSSTPYQQSFGYLSEDIMVGAFGDRISQDGDDGMQYWRDILRGNEL